MWAGCDASSEKHRPDKLLVFLSSVHLGKPSSTQGALTSDLGLGDQGMLRDRAHHPQFWQREG